MKGLAHWASLALLITVAACGARPGVAPSQKARASASTTASAGVASSPPAVRAPAVTDAPSVFVPPPLLPPLPTVEERTLPSGARLRLVEVEQPLSLLSLRFAAGGLHDRPGVARLTAAWVATAVGRRAPGVSADFRVDVGSRSSGFTLAVAPGEEVAAVALLAEIAAAARWRQQPGFEATRAAALVRWRAQLDGPTAGASEPMREVAQRALLGDGGLAARLATRATSSELLRIRAEHCASFYERYYRADNSTWTFVGGAPSAALLAAIERGSARQQRNTPAPTRAAVELGDQAHPLHIYVLDQAHAEDATLLLGLSMPPRARHTAEMMRELLWRGAHDRLRGRLPTVTVNTALARWTPERDVLLLDAHVPPAALRDAARALLDAAVMLQAPVPRHRLAEAQGRVYAALTGSLSQPFGVLRWSERRAPEVTASAWALRPPAQLANEITRLRAALSQPRVLVARGPADALVAQLQAFGEVRVVDPEAGFARLGGALPAFEMDHAEPTERPPAQPSPRRR